MKKLAGVVMAILCLTAAAPASAEASSLQVAQKFAGLVKKAKWQAASQLMAPRIVWENQNYPDGKEVGSGAYRIYLAVSGSVVGPIRSVSCKAIDAIQISCSFSRIENMGHGQPRDVVERYFVEGGKIVKVANIVQPEVTRMARSRTESE